MNFDQNLIKIQQTKIGNKGLASVITMIGNLMAVTEKDMKDATAAEAKSSDGFTISLAELTNVKNANENLLADAQNDHAEFESDLKHTEGKRDVLLQLDLFNSDHCEDNTNGEVCAAYYLLQDTHASCDTFLEEFDQLTADKLAEIEGLKGAKRTLENV